MTPAEMIAHLDDALLETGETIIVRRYTAPTGTPRPKTDVGSIRARRRDLRDTDLVGDIGQTSTVIVVSPTGLESLLPLKKGDKVILQGAEKNIELVKSKIEQDVLVRMDLMVAG